MVVVKNYRYRAYPTDAQIALFNNTVGCCRLIWNKFLNLHEEDYKLNKKSLSRYSAVKLLKKLKETDTYAFLKEVESSSLRITIESLYDSYNKFFKKKGGKPHLKSKKNENIKSYSTQMVNNNIRFKKNHILLPKMGWVRIKNHTFAEGIVKKMIIKQMPSGKFFITVTCEVDIKPKSKKENQVALDLGVHNIITTSNGDKYDTIKPLFKSKNKLLKAQRKLSKKKVNSNSFNKQRAKLAKLHEKIANTRKYYLDTLSICLINTNGIIYIEDLDVKSMIINKSRSKKDKNINRATLNASMSKFVGMLEYKSNWYGRKLVKVDKFFPSSQLCHCCNYKNVAVKDPEIREWTCPKCNTHHDRDINAAINILIEGQRILSLSN